MVDKSIKLCAARGYILSVREVKGQQFVILLYWLFLGEYGVQTTPNKIVYMVGYVTNQKKVVYSKGVQTTPKIIVYMVGLENRILSPGG